MKKTYEYNSFSDDFFDDGKEHKLPCGYVWIKKDPISKIKSALSYGLALIFANIYCRLFLHIKIKGGDVLKNGQGGFFLYANHTQPVGDVFTPALVTFPKRIYTVVSPSNFDIPIIGKLIFSLGALPVPDSLKNMRKFREAVKTRINEGHPVIIYPEAHVWPYYTGIRPFSESAFMFPEDSLVPAYVMTSTYKKRRGSGRPKTVIYIKGPFYGKGDTPKERALYLRDKVYDVMCEDSRRSDYEYIKYKQNGGAG